MKLSLITCTGARPEAFRLCERWMSRQTHKWDQWVVVDDGPEPTQVRMADTVIRPSASWRPGQNTYAFNLQTALQAATGDVVAFIEDDDYYRPTYLERMMIDALRYDVIGEANAIYYHIAARKWRALGNQTFACLAQTVISGLPARSMLWQILDGINYGEDVNVPLGIDVTFWHSLKSFCDAPYAQDLMSGILPRMMLHADSQMVIGMKGLPGRPGIGVGHRLAEGTWLDDRGLKKLEELVGRDLYMYQQFFQEKENG